MRNILQLRGTVKDCLNNTQVVQEIRPAGEKWDLVRSKRFCTSGKAVNQVKRHPQSRRKSLSDIHPIEDWCLHYTKNSRHKETTTKNLNTKKEPIQKWALELTIKRRNTKG